MCGTFSGQVDVSQRFELDVASSTRVEMNEVDFLFIGCYHDQLVQVYYFYR